MDTSLTAQPDSLESDLATGKLEEHDLYMHDPLFLLLAFFREKIHLNIVTWTAIIVTVVLVSTAIVLFGFTALAVPGTSFDLGPHFGMTVRALMQIFIFSILAAIYLLLPYTIAHLFQSFKDNGVIGPARQDIAGPITYEGFLRRMVSWLDNPRWSTAAIGIVVLFWLYWLLIIVPQSEQLLKDHSLASWRFSLQVVNLLLIYSPLIYCSFLCVVRLLITLSFTSLLFHRFTIKINPLHPDGYAGLGALQSMLSISTVLMVVLGVAALVMNSSFLLGNDNVYSRAEAIGMGIGYIALAPTLLIGWLIVPHRVMREVHDDALCDLTVEYQSALKEVNATIGGDASTLKQGTDRLVELKRRYDLIDHTYPTWPVEIESVRRMAATISIPAIIPFLIPLFTTLFVYLSHLFGVVFK
jgi:hypothetical protein